MGLEMAKKGLMSHQKALEVTGHNISNADSKEYTRQRAIIQSADPIYTPALNRASGAGQLGQGSVISAVERIRNHFLDDRIINEKNSFSYWETRRELLYQVEVIYNEPSGNSLRTRFDKFWNSWQELSKYPQEGSVRNVLVQQGKALAGEFRHIHQKLHELRNHTNTLIEDRVNKINNLAGKVRELNMGIRKAEELGDNPNDLHDRRDALLQKLSELVNVQVSRNDKDELVVNVGGENLVQGNIVQPLELRGDPQNNGYYKVQWQNTGETPTLLGGELKALVEIRDEILVRNMNEMDSMALSLSSRINEIHRDGFGLNEQTNMNFFEHKAIAEDIYGNWDMDGDGQADRSAIYKISGVNEINPDAEVGMNGRITLHQNDADNTPVYIDYNATDKVKDIIHKINISDAGVEAYINHNDQLTFKAKLSQDDQQSHFMIRHVEDSNQFLVGMAGVLNNSGPQGAFSWNRINDVRKFQGGPKHYDITPEFNPAMYMKVSNEIAANPNNIAAAKGKDIGGTGDANKSNGEGDGQAAMAIASIRGDKKAMADASSSFDDFFNGMVTRAGAEASVAKDNMENKEKLLHNLTQLRESISGVNLDEEMANMVQFQNSYNASARIISTINEMLETIIRLGA